MDDIRAFVAQVGFPVLVRPSYVLSGAAMNVCSNAEELQRFLQLAARVSPRHPVVVSQFIEHAKEVEMDAVAQRGEIVAYAISEHIEFAGVHSGDATIQFPQKLYVETVRRIKRISRQIARELDITGPFNIQFLARDNDIKVIECNLRASRSFPFVSKVLKLNFIELATQAMLGVPVTKPDKNLFDLDYVGIKASQFSFNRLQGADPVLGVDMASTGEVGCLGKTPPAPCSRPCSRWASACPGAACCSPPEAPSRRPTCCLPPASSPAGGTTSTPRAAPPSSWRKTACPARASTGPTSRASPRPSV